MAKQINVKVFFYLRTNYKNRFGKNAIMVKIGINGKWKSIGSTGIYLFKEEWDSFNKKVKGKSRHASNTNMKLRFIENELLEIAAELPMRDDYLNKPQIRNFVCCGLMGWDLIRLVMPMAGIELQIAADVHSYPLPHDAA